MNEIREKLKEVDRLKQEIGENRDKLRNIVSDIEDVISSLEMADDSLGLGISYIEEAIEEISQHV